MKIPDKMHLLGEEYEILQVSKHDLTCDECGEDAIGLIEPDKKRISISIDDSENEAIEILLHELGHYFAFYYGLGKNETIAEAFAKFTSLIIEQLKYK